MGGKNCSKGNKGSYAEVTPPVTSDVLKLIHAGLYANQIALRLGRSKTTIHRHIDRLKKRGLISDDVRSSFKAYNITHMGETAIKDGKLPETSSITTGLKLGTHLRIKIPIIRRGRIEKWDTVNTRFKNNIVRHRDLKDYIDGVSVKENADSSLELNIKHRKIPALREVLPLVTSSLMWAVGFFSAHGYTLDFTNYCINDIHSTAWTKEIEHVARRGGRHTLWFPWNRAKLTPRDPDQRARSWTDGTPEWNVETNCLNYMDMFLRMPVTVSEMMSVQRIQAENLADLSRQVSVYAEHMNAHIPLLRELAPATAEMKKFMRNINKRIFQRRLSEFV